MVRNPPTTGNATPSLYESHAHPVDGSIVPTLDERSLVDLTGIGLRRRPAGGGDGDVGVGSDWQDAAVSTGDATSDPVLGSVGAYSAGVDEYEAAYASKFADIVARFAESLPTPSLILDVGCGPGRDLERFTVHGHVARGVELNPEFVARARRHAPTTHCDVRDVAAHFPSGFFDGIWASASLVHLPTADMYGVLGQLGVLLRPGGKLFVSVRSAGDTGWLDEPDGRRWYRVWAAEALAEAVTAAGFTVDELTPGTYTELWATRDQDD
jgi:SAM-dependent methyltransferase